MKYRMGLDLGIASVGWSVVQMDENDRPCQIVDLGVRKFKPAEDLKTGASPSVARRNARGMRRNIRRRRYRLDKLSALLTDKLLDGKKIDFSPCDIYTLRAKAVQELLTDQELARVLYSMMKHRGFQSNRKSELKDKDTGKMLEQMKLNGEELRSYATIGEMYINSPKFKEQRTKLVDGKEISYDVYHVRNKGQKHYEKTFDRKDILAEIELILHKQQELGNQKIDKAFQEKYKQIFTYQKSYDEGPDRPSPYHVEFKVGNCTYLPDEKRAPKASFQFEYFSALHSINNLRYVLDGTEKSLEQNEKEILQNALLQKGKVNFSEIKTLLHLPKQTEFKNVNIRKREPSCFVDMPATTAIANVLSLKPADFKLNPELINAIGYILSMCKTDSNRRKAFSENQMTKDLSKEIVDALLELDYATFGSLSIKALDKIIPYLEKGIDYRHACDAAGLFEPGFEKTKKLIYGNLKELEEPTSPVVKRAISQTIKVVNALIDRFGSPCAIYIELGRDFGRNIKDRRKLETMMAENTANNEKWRNNLIEMGITRPTGDDITKYRLYEEQGGKCIYSGKSFESTLGSLKNIFFDNATQIDHILPFSKTYDNSYPNKVLVLTSENQLKGNRTPYEYMEDNPAKWEAFQTLVLSIYTKKSDKRKRENLFLKHLSEEKIKELNNRALKDTQYLAVFMKDLFEKHLIFQESSLQKQPVRSVNGAMTSLLRKVWGIPKKRFASDLHHAEDAAIVACTDAHMIQGVTKYLQFNRHARCADPVTGEVLEPHQIIQELQIASMPYPTFRDELRIRLDKGVPHRLPELLKLGYTPEELNLVRPVLTSRMVNHKLNGPIHADFVYSDKLKREEDGKKIVTVKTPIQKLKLNKNMEIEGYPEKLKEDDRLLYQALRERLITAGNKGHAFDEPFYKPTKSGLHQNLVKTVKLERTISGEMPINGGFVVNDSMIRVDVFKKRNKFYFIPVYVADYYKKQLPSKICLSKKWPDLDDTYDFQFSLYQNDVIRLKMSSPIKMAPKEISGKKQSKQTETRQEQNEPKKTKDSVLCDDEFFYYTSFDRSSASITIETLNGELTRAGLGTQKAIIFEKYEMDLLGKYSKVEHEKRRGF